MYSSSMKSLTGSAACLLVSLVLLAAGGFCCVEAQRIGMEVAQIVRVMEAVRATQVLATQWRAEVERVRSETDSNFDGLADFSGRVGRQVRIIRNSQGAILDRSAETDRALNSYVRRLRAQEERIERFKSGFAIVRNSRRFIPSIGEQLAEAAREMGYGKVEAAILRVLETVQGFLKQPTGPSRHRMEQAAHMLAGNADGTPLRAQAEPLNKHVYALLQHHRLTEQHFEGIMRTDLEGSATRAVDLLNADYRQRETKRRYFDYGFRGSLALALLYWTTLIVRWAGKRRKGKAAVFRAPDVVPVEGSPAPRGLDVALATAGGPGFFLEGAPGPGRLGGEVRRQAEKAEEEVRPRSVQYPDVRLRPAQYPEPLPEDAHEDEAADARGDGAADGREDGAADAAVEEVRRGASTSPGVRMDREKDRDKDRMANVQDGLRKVVDIDGAIGAALVDVNDALTLATAGGGEGEAFNIEAASTANLDVIRAKLDVLERLGLDDSIEDILITLGRQYHLIRPLERNSAGLFLYVVLDRERGNLGLARHQLKRIEADRFGVLPA